MTALLTAALVACGGGSGSTGLIVPERSVLGEVRREGTCAILEDVVYCATNSPDAVAPGGQSANAPIDPTDGPPMPCTDGDPCSRDELGFTVSGFAPGAACAPAARRGGSDEPWAIGPLVPVGGATAPVAVTVPAGLDAEVALLCFTAPPAALPDRVDTLADAGPDIVFVPRE